VFNNGLTRQVAEIQVVYCLDPDKKNIKEQQSTHM
jgi:hypothetical protein